MENTMTAASFYASILRSVGCTIHPETGHVHINDGTEAHPPLTINKRQLVVPEPAVLRVGLGDTKIGFAPAGESVVRKESPVMKRLRELTNTRITYVLSELLEQLMRIAADHSKHPLLTPEQSEFLSIVPEVDQKTCTALGSVLDRISDKTDHALVRIYIKPNGKIGDTVYKRLAAVAFPIMDAKRQDGHKIFGVQMRKDDKKSILALFDYLIPNADVVGHWNAGSHDMSAPCFQALMYAYAGIIKQLNSVVELFDNVLSGNAIPLYSELDWTEGIDDIAKWRAAIPTLPGNDGELIRDPQTGETPTAAPVAASTVATSTSTGTTSTTAKSTAPVVQSNGLMQIARPLSEAKGYNSKPAATQTQGFVVTEQPVQHPVAQPPQQNWMDIQRQQQVQQHTYAPPPAYAPPAYAPPPAYAQPNGYNNSGYAVRQPAPPPMAQYPVGQLTQLPVAPGPVPAHLQHVYAFVDTMGNPFDQNGQPLPPEIMAQLGYALQAPAAPGGYYQQPAPYGAPPSNVPVGRAAGMARANAKLQAEQYPPTPYGHGGYAPRY